MTDWTQDLERELVSLRPAKPCADLELRLKRELDRGRRLPIAAVGMPRATLRWPSIILGLAAAACLAICLGLWLRQAGPISDTAQAVPQELSSKVVPSVSQVAAQKAGGYERIKAANYLVGAEEEGIIYASATLPMRRVRYQFLDTSQWKAATDGTIVQVIVPRERTALVPLNVH